MALHYLDGFPERYQAAVRNGDTFLKLLEADGRIHIYRVKSGSNIFGISLSSGATLDQLRQRLSQAGITLAGPPNAKQGILQINETLNRRPPDQLARAFLNALQ